MYKDGEFDEPIARFHFGWDLTQTERLKGWAPHGIYLGEEEDEEDFYIYVFFTKVKSELCNDSLLPDNEYFWCPLFKAPDGLQICYFVINVQNENDVKILKWKEDDTFALVSAEGGEFKMINHPKPGEDFYDYHIITPYLRGGNKRLLDPAIYKNTNGVYYLFAAQRKEPNNCDPTPDRRRKVADASLESFLVWSQYFVNKKKKDKNKDKRDGKHPKKYSVQMPLDFSSPAPLLAYWNNDIDKIKFQVDYLVIECLEDPNCPDKDSDSYETLKVVEAPVALNYNNIAYLYWSIGPSEFTFCKKYHSEENHRWPISAVRRGKLEFEPNGEPLVSLEPDWGTTDSYMDYNNARCGILTHPDPITVNGNLLIRASGWCGIPEIGIVEEVLSEDENGDED